MYVILLQLHMPLLHTSSTWDTYFLRENVERTKYVSQQDGADFYASTIIADYLSHM